MKPLHVVYLFTFATRNWYFSPKGHIWNGLKVKLIKNVSYVICQSYPNVDLFAPRITQSLHPSYCYITNYFHAWNGWLFVELEKFDIGQLEQF